MRRALAAVVLAVAATLAGFGLVTVGGAGVATLELAVHDALAPALAPVSRTLVIVARDAASEARLGTGAWDRAVLARTVSGLARAGAVAIGLDTALGQPSAPGRGGAASDALLVHATTAAGNVVLPVAPAGSPPALDPPAKALGHMQAPPDADGIVRRVPILVRHDGRTVVALGVALAVVGARAEETTLRIPTDGEGRALLRWAPDLPVTPFNELWLALERGDAERLRDMVDGKTVLVLTEPTADRRLTPIGPLADVAIQAELLNAVQTGAWLRPVPTWWRWPGAFVLAALTAWLGLAPRGRTALLGVALLVLGYGAALSLAPGLAAVVLPAVTPLGTMIAAGAAALVWTQVGAAGRLRSLEGEMGGIREVLVRQESTVEALEEDLEAARAAVARSTGAERELVQAAQALREQLAAARSQEEQTRARLASLERELRTTASHPASLPDAEQERLRRQCAELGIVTRDPVVLALFRDLQKAARSSLPILLGGEPGTGKELFARAAHRLSPRAGGPFVAVNMAAIPPELFESELFGHVRGSFTGAVGERRGYFEQADGGTIFLDEIGELRAEHQGKLLRVLQERTFHRVGAARPTAVDVRVVAASNRDLGRGVTEGWFREDLAFRLRGLVLRLPPLRERRGDVAPLAERFLEEAAAEAGRRLTLSEAAMAALERHDWPGNVRELQHCLRRAVALSEREVLAPEDLRLETPGPIATEADGDTAVLDCLRRHGFDMQATARALGWDRSTVTQRLKGLGFRALVEARGDRGQAAAALAGAPALARTVELKLAEYHEHLLRAVAGFDSADAAVAACRRRFKNLPERHFRSLETLVRERFT
ncbi:MAG TPA: sigma 54-interacting transcriptional regulator [Methylomirabilota bacterium]|nr:sigma 54-interacting transcriptional regulator [Methylomirabilota bacterium]